MHWRSALEIFILSIFVYFILRFVRGTRGARVLMGLVTLLILMTLIGEIFELTAISWLLDHFFSFMVVALVVIFQPELRRALAEVGTQPLFFTTTHERQMVDMLVKGVMALSSRKVGALIAVEREIGLRGIGETGAVLDARVSTELLDQIFFPNSPLHDGGVIIQSGRVIAAACIFPLTQRIDLPKSVGTRHRAALGLTEETDAVVVVVSEETGNVSVACKGDLHQHLDRDALHALLTKLLVGATEMTWLGKLQSLFSKRIP